MNRYFKCILLLILLLSLIGCKKEISEFDFMKFSTKCQAEEYYQICNNLKNDSLTRFYYNCDSSVLFKTYTMVEKIVCDTDEFELIKNQIEATFSMKKIVSEYIINDISYEMFIVENDNQLYDSFQKFGFIAFNKENNFIDFYWFYNQDYDMSIYDEESFDMFFKENYYWTN